MTYQQILNRLHALSSPEKVAQRQAMFKITSTNALGITHKDLNELVKSIPKDDNLALELYGSGIYEGKLLCSKIFNPKNLTKKLAVRWVKEFDNWEVCDSFCMSVFSRSQDPLPMAFEWTARNEEFEKRAGFATIAAYCTSDKKAENHVYKACLPYIMKEADDDRNFVKKAISWALRAIGKRNIDLREEAIAVAIALSEGQSKASKWIGKDALRELQKKMCELQIILDLYIELQENELFNIVQSLKSVGLWKLNTISKVIKKHP